MHPILSRYIGQSASFADIPTVLSQAVPSWASNLSDHVYRWISNENYVVVAG